MAKVKINNIEYEIGSLKLKDVKDIQRQKDKLKLDDFDYNSYALWYVINKHNPDKLSTWKDFDDAIDIGDFADIQQKIMEGSGLDKYFNTGIGKKL